VYFDFANVLVFFVVGLGFIVMNLALAWVLRPKGEKSPGKIAIYECGEPTIGQAWVRFDIRFYTVALTFVVFDIEIALLFPWAAVFRDMVREGQGWLAFLEVGAFLVVLAAGLVYVWAHGDLDWTQPGIAEPAAAKPIAPITAPPEAEPEMAGAGTGGAHGARG
jgi:NADH-quinone oxidoreductase subunit A